MVQFSRDTIRFGREIHHQQWRCGRYLPGTMPTLRFSKDRPPLKATYPASVYGPVYLYFSPDGSFCFGGSPDGWDMIVGVRRRWFHLQFRGDLLHREVSISTLLRRSPAAMPQPIPSYDRVQLDQRKRSSRPIGFLWQWQARGLRRHLWRHHNRYDLRPVQRSQTAAPWASPPGSVLTLASGSPGTGAEIAWIQRTGRLCRPNQPAEYRQLRAIYLRDLAGRTDHALYGTNLANGTVIAPPGAFPTSLGGVQVIINGVAALLYYVSLRASSPPSFLMKRPPRLPPSRYPTAPPPRI